MHWFALKSLLSDRGKALTALVGVVFSLVLVNIQGGLYIGLMQKARMLTDHCDAEIWVAHPDVQLVDLPQAIPQTLVQRIRSVAGVQAAEPYIVGNAYASFPDGHYENVWVLGSDSRTQLGTGWSFTAGDADSLRRPHGVSVDELDAGKLRAVELGNTFEVNGHQARVVAKTRGILPFTTTPYLFTSLDNARLYTDTPAGYCSYFLVKTAPDADLRQVRSAIQQRLPQLSALTAAELGRRSEQYWMGRTGIGISFGTATLLGLLVGLIMIAQSLYALALDHLTDYATLKAIGADERDVRSVVLWQSVTLAAAGSTIGVAVVYGMQRLVSSPIAPIELPLPLLVLGVMVVFGICTVAAVLPVLRIQRLDPALVLQS